MLLTSEEATIRVNSPDNLLNRIRRVPENNAIVKPYFNVPPTLYVPDEVKAMLGATYNAGNESSQEIADAYGVSHDLVRDASRGLVGAGYRSNLAAGVESKTNALLNRKAEVEDTAHELALSAMVSALTSLTEKLAGVDSPKDLSKIATDMSRISSNIKASNTEADLLSKVKVVVFAPNTKSESSYDIIDVVTTVE